MELQLDSPLFIINCLTGTLMIIVGLISRYFPPKKINSLYGYRTSRSMKNDRNWQFAQTYSTKILMLSSFIYLLIGLIGLVIEIKETIATTISIATLVACLGLTIYKTEQALKQFEKNEENNRN